MDKRLLCKPDDLSSAVHNACESKAERNRVVHVCTQTVWCVSADRQCGACLQTDSVVRVCRDSVVREYREKQSGACLQTDRVVRV